MIKFFRHIRLSKLNFVKQNQMSSGHLVEIATSEKNRNKKYD